MTAPREDVGETERLLRFLYMCPVGLADVSATGEVRMMNAVAVQMLMPLVRDAQMENLFQVLAQVAPDLPQIVAAYAADSGSIVQDRRLRVTAGSAERHYSLNLLRVEGDTYMAVVSDVTQLVLNEAITREALQVRAVQEGRVEVLTSVLHDIGNGITGIGTRTAMLSATPDWEELEQLVKLGGFLRQRRTLLEPALGADKTGALLGFADTVTTRLQARAAHWRETIDFYAVAIAHVQQIIYIQRQFIRGGGGTARATVAITELMDDAIAIHRSALEKRGVAIVLDYAPNLPRIEADRTRLIQVFVNTLKNVAEEFDAQEAGPGRSLRIAVQTVADEKLEITFTDNAGGFAAPDGLYPITRGQTTKPGGSGLGLHASALMIAAHHGTFTLRSPGPGRGAVCTIQLPLRPSYDPATS